jgi:hypothetical protein
MTAAVTIADDYACVIRRYVAEGQAVAPGADLLDIITPSGVVQTIHADCWGIVAHAEGSQVSSVPSDDRYIDYVNTHNDLHVYVKGDIVCHIVQRDNSAGVRKTGLHPKPSQKMRAMRLGFFLI